MSWNSCSAKTRTGSSEDLQDTGFACNAYPGNCFVRVFDAGPALDYLDPACVVAGCGNARLFFLRISEKPFAAIECRPCPKTNIEPASRACATSATRMGTRLPPTAPSGRAFPTGPPGD